MDIIIYIGIGLLCLWAARTLVRTVRVQLKGSCSCSGNCGSCGGCSARVTQKGLLQNRILKN